jgi:uncharacterized protein (TIGR03437 family)
MRPGTRVGKRITRRAFPKSASVARGLTFCLSGLAPGFAGVWQIRVVVPRWAPVGEAPVEVVYEGEVLRSVSVTIR